MHKVRQSQTTVRNGESKISGFGFHVLRLKYRNDMQLGIPYLRNKTWDT